MQTQSRDLAKTYDPTSVESRWYDWWDSHGYFAPHGDGEPYTIIMPPPNVTGELHTGHALFATVEDVLTRFKRMQGRPTLWLPGADHAGIAGQWVVEKELALEGITRHDLGREKFLERVWEWMDLYRGRIREQLRILGASCDWSRFVFTMDPGPARAVRTAFKKLYDKGLIYKGERMINWCPRCMTALSDLEVNHEELQGHIWTLRYPIEGEGGRYVDVATTRPETMLGDTGVAVHPEDERYLDLLGRTVTLPIMQRSIPIVADAAVDPAFGTGAVKITPAHDPNDFEIGRRHGLPAITVMNLDGTMNENAGVYVSQDRYEARKYVVARLQEEGLLARVEEHTHSVGRCDRCNTIVEPLISEQWFLRMDELKELAAQAARDGSVRFTPERYKGVYLNWIANEYDWCISRQLWWGHRIPVWYCAECGEVSASDRETVEACPHCGSSRIEQDPDVLDTWFSSGLWPFSTLGWPDETPDLARYYPSSVMETGDDIIFKWVHRMIFFGMEFMGEPPFPDVLLHGQVRDAQGQRMSKSKGNGIDPTEVTAQYGSDALRFTLATAGPMGSPVKLSTEKVEANRNFANKIWNATRYVLRALEGADLATAPDGSLLPPDPSAMSLPDRWILSRLHAVTAEVTEQLERFNLNEAGRRLYDFTWSELCDWYIESTKVALGGTDEAAKSSARQTLAYTLERSLRLLHPFMPFLTEELWQHLPHSGEALIAAPWPPAEGRDVEAEEEYALVIELVRAVRNARAENNVPPARPVTALIAAGQWTDVLRGQRDLLARLARIDSGSLQIEPELAETPAQAVSLVIGQVQVYLPLAGLVDLGEERRRLQGELENARAESDRTRARLANTQFTERAPAQVVDRERAKLAAAEQRATLLEERLRSLG
ncbi:MAG: valine--tRNA ligase [Chloroflexota bacterium]|nr:valine--tRNA ligase [Chloroflexota bacterium]